MRDYIKAGPFYTKGFGKPQHQHPIIWRDTQHMEIGKIPDQTHSVAVRRGKIITKSRKLCIVSRHLCNSPPKFQPVPRPDIRCGGFIKRDDEAGTVLR